MSFPGLPTYLFGIEHGKALLREIGNEGIEIYIPAYLSIYKQNRVPVLD